MKTKTNHPYRGKNAFKSSILILLAAAPFFNVQAQEGKTFNDAKNFDEMRKKEFSNLIGGAAQDAVSASYSTDKTALEGSGTFGAKDSRHLFQIKASVGTTTNLSNLFNQKVLPTFSGSLTWNMLIRGWASRWFYDANFKSNFDELKTGSKDVSDIVTEAPFTYSAALKEKVQKGGIDSDTTLYSFKRFSWLSLTGKYDNTKYSFYDASRAFASQLYDPMYRSWNAKLAWNSYLTWDKTNFDWGWRPNFVYLNVAVQYGLGNNIQQLKKTTVNDISSTQIDGSTTRQTLKSNSVYNGVYKEYNTLTPSFDLVVSPIKSFALNGFGEYNVIGDKDKTKYSIDNYGSIAAGVYYYGTGSTKINIGVFYKWTRDNATKTWTEQIGLRTTIPITPN